MKATAGHSRWCHGGHPYEKTKDGSIEAYFNGKWQPIHKLRLWKEAFADNPAAVKEELLTRYAEILKEVQSRIGTGRRLPATWKAGKLPDTWVFSDFGRITIKYFIDYNGNRKLECVDI